MTEWYYAGVVSVKVAAGQTLIKVEIVVLSVWLKRVDIEMTEFQFLGFLEGVFLKPEEYAWKSAPKEDQAANLDF